jgi:hypothetical protein
MKKLIISTPLATYIEDVSVSKIFIYNVTYKKIEIDSDNIDSWFSVLENSIIEIPGSYSKPLTFYSNIMNINITSKYVNIYCYDIVGCDKENREKKLEENLNIFNSSKNRKQLLEATNQIKIINSDMKVYLDKLQNLFSLDDMKKYSQINNIYNYLKSLEIFDASKGKG